MDDGAGKQRFVVHEHHAPRLHYDLRLERGGVLVSWAVPKGVPLEQGVNRLAVHVPDHDLDHLTYTDEQKSIWDIGTYAAHDFTDDKVVLTFTGQRLTGSYALIHTGDTQWLIRRISESRKGVTIMALARLDVEAFPRGLGREAWGAWPDLGPGCPRGGHQRIDAVADGRRQASRR